MTYLKSAAPPTDAICRAVGLALLSRWSIVSTWSRSSDGKRAEISDNDSLI